MKKTLFLFSLILCLPCTVLATTEQERIAKLEVIPYEEVEEEKVINAKVINPDVLKDQLPEEDYDFYTNMLKLYLNYQNIPYDNKYYFEFSDKNNLTITYCNWEEDDCDLPQSNTTYNYKVNWLTTYDKTLKTEAASVAKSLNDNYSIHGMALIKSNYHYNNIETSPNYKNNIMLYRYKELKKDIEENKGWDFISHQYNEGGTPYMSWLQGYVGVIKNGIIYDIKQIKLNNYNLLYVDKNETGTVKEKALKKLNEYFNNEYSITIDPDSYTQTNNLWEDQHIHEEVNRYLKTNDVNYTSTYYEFNVGGTLLPMSVVEVETNLLDNIDVETFDADTGVTVTTDSYEVPYDARVLVTDVKDKDYMSYFSKNNKLDIEEAYDIDLKKLSDGTLIKKIDGKFEVYIPVSNYKVGDKVKVYYIKEDGTLGGKYTGDVVEKDEDLFAKFTTNHFSTYAIASESNNPETGDNIKTFIILGALSLLIIGGCYFYYKKRI